MTLRINVKHICPVPHTLMAADHINPLMLTARMVWTPCKRQINISTRTLLSQNRKPLVVILTFRNQNWTQEFVLRFPTLQVCTSKQSQIVVHSLVKRWLPGLETRLNGVWDVGWHMKHVWSVRTLFNTGVDKKQLMRHFQLYKNLSECSPSCYITIT